MAADSNQPKDFNILPIVGLFAGLLCLCGMCAVGSIGSGLFAIASQITPSVPPLAFPTSSAQTKATATSNLQFGATSTAQAQWSVINTSTFDLNLQNWTSGSYDNETYGAIVRRVFNGKYLWEVNAKRGVLWWGLPDMSPASDFLVTLEAKEVSGPQDSSYGAVFRQVDDRTFYYFAIRDTGEFLFSLQDRGQWRTLIGWTYSPAIKPGQANQISVSATGPHFSFFVNGQLVADFNDPTLSKGKIGLAIEMNQSGQSSFEFDNFELRVPPNSVTATSSVKPIMTNTATPTVTPAPTVALGEIGQIAFINDSKLYVTNGSSATSTQLAKDILIDNYFPSWSPDGSMIAFTSGRPEDIYVTRADGLSKPVNLTSSKANENSPTWSPDGKYIAYISVDIRTQTQDIYVMEADGSGQLRLTKTLLDNDFPHWSPTGKKIVFSSDPYPGWDIYVIDSDGSSQKQLTFDPSSEKAPKWSPDGSRIAFQTNRDGNWEIYIMDPDGSNPKNVTNNSAEDTLPVWSPNGKYIAFVSDRDGKEEIYIMNSDGSGQTRLTTNGGTYPAWRP